MMLNLIKSLAFQLRNSFAIKCALALSLVMSILMLIQSGSDVNGGMYFALNAYGYASVYIFISLFFACVICGADFSDKTINYEILAGHKRFDCFLSRVIVTFMLVIIVAAVMEFLPLVIAVLMNGWGNNADFGDCMLRFGLTLLALIRLTSFFVFITFLLRNIYVSAVAGYMTALAVMMIYMVVNSVFSSSFRITYHFAISNMQELMDFSDYKLGFVNGEDVMMFITEIPNDMIVGTVVCSAVMSAVWLALSCIIFRKSDLS